MIHLIQDQGVYIDADRFKNGIKNDYAERIAMAKLDRIISQGSIDLWMRLVDLREIIRPASDIVGEVVSDAMEEE